MTLKNRIVVVVRPLRFARIVGVIIATLAAIAVAQPPSHGPKKGYLLITGGATQAPDFQRFIEMSGGKNAHIVVIPTASVTKPTDQATLQAQYCTGPKSPFAQVNCTVIHTTDRAVANSPDFVAPLKTATGIWLEGGRHWRLADAYLDTLTLKEILAELDRGGTVGGGSAGATIQGSYMVRGSSNPDDNTIMMAPGHEIGFGLFTNVTIDQHVDVRHRENDLAAVIKAHPDLLMPRPRPKHLHHGPRRQTDSERTEANGSLGRKRSRRQGLLLPADRRPTQYSHSSRNPGAPSGRDHRQIGERDQTTALDKARFKTLPRAARGTAQTF